MHLDFKGKEGNRMAERIIEKDITWKEVEERAALVAEADEIASGNLGKETIQIGTESTKEKKDLYKVKMRKAVDFDDGSGMKNYSSIDMSGLHDLTTVDGEYFDRVLTKMDYAPKNKFRDTTYAKIVAMKVTGLPVEFFNMLDMRDMVYISVLVNYHFLAD